MRTPSPPPSAASISDTTKTLLGQSVAKTLRPKRKQQRSPIKTDPDYPLNEKQQKFVTAILLGMTARQAGKEANLSAVSDHHRRANVKRAIAIGRDEMRKHLGRKAAITVDSSIEELDTIMAFARETNNATAMTRCAELKMKLSGLLVEKVQHQGTPFHINIVGMDAPTDQQPRLVHEVPPAMLRNLEIPIADAEIISDTPGGADPQPPANPQDKS